MKIIIAWIKKYILHVHSPSAHARGFDFEYDYLKSLTSKRISELEKENAELSMRIAELEAQLEESRSKEGKGVLEKMAESISNCISSIDFSALMEINHPDLLDNEITIENDEEE